MENEKMKEYWEARLADLEAAVNYAKQQLSQVMGRIATEETVDTPLNVE